MLLYQEKIANELNIAPTSASLLQN